ncbi:MAG: hypothetical protein IIY46_08090 [Lachnospiraceae bacterium]|nr:hypothetical protein [Lachnospiraceae bacterium]
MSPFCDILGMPGALLILLTALFLMIAQTVIVLLSIREKRSRRQVWIAALHFAAGFLFFVIVLEGFDVVNYPSIPRDSVQTGWFVYSLPWLVYPLLEAISAVILILHFLEYRRYRKGTVTRSAIRQSIDLLPEGVMISAQDGTVHLANLKMSALCREVTGERLYDANRFRTHLADAGTEQGGGILIHTQNGKVWRFAKENLAIDGTEYIRTSAVDVTERYRITEELREKNIRLQEMQRRMKEAADLSQEMFIKQEEAGARSALHNELGQVLLMGRHCIEHPESTDRAMVAVMTRQMNRFLLGESRTPEPDAGTGDALREALRMAGSIGVVPVLSGDPPGREEVRSLLAAAIRECAANTVKHAGGDRLFVEISKDGTGTCMTISNNGDPPKAPIAESGGLLSLRRSVEDAGGQMTVKSLPVFRLKLSFPDK